MSATVGLLGVGRMGAGICACLGRGGHDVLAFDARPEREDAVLAAGARWAPGAAALAGADVLVSSLPGSPAARVVASIMSTNGTPRRAASRAAATCSELQGIAITPAPAASRRSNASASTRSTSASATPCVIERSSAPVSGRFHRDSRGSAPVWARTRAQTSSYRRAAEPTPAPPMTPRMGSPSGTPSEG